MQIKAESPQDYITQVSDDKREAIRKLREVIVSNLPDGFKECVNYGMIGYVVPHELFPQGYHCDPKLPLPFMSIAAQKNFVAVYHMGIYSNDKLLDWFTREHARTVSSKLDMGKGCIRYRKPDQIPYELIGTLASKMTTDDWIKIYTTALDTRSKK